MGPIHAPSAAGAPAAVAAPAGLSAKAAQRSATGQSASLTSVPLPGGQAVIFTASLSLRAADIQGAVARATQLAQAAGGYVSGEHASMSQSRRQRPVITIQFKVPAASYQAILAALGGLGRKLSETQQAQDVTGTVADVNSRVVSSEAAISQLRKLLGRAGSVGGLLSVQDQINAEEANLEALQSQQRALARETSYATITLTVTGNLPPAHRGGHHQHLGLAGFSGGLAAGWRGLRVTVDWVLTLAGALLPFAIPLALAALAARSGRRWLGRRRAGAVSPPPAG